VEPVTLQTLSQWTGGKLLSGDPGRTVTRVCTDSRTLKNGDLFLALRGENFDAHAFVGRAAEIGAAGAVVDRDAENLPTDFAVIRVADTLAALQQIAANYRRTLPLKAVVITGSNGKTSTKDFTAAVLARRFRVVKTEGNLNNHIGLPLTLLRASADDEVGVLEIGMNHPGEIAPLAAIARPDVGVITNIGVAHIEFMGSRDAIALEKGMLAEALDGGGYLVLDTEDDYTPAVAERTRAKVIRSGADICVTDVRHDADGSRFVVHANDRSAEVRLHVPGRHMIRNAMLAVAVGTIFGLTLEECAAGLAEARLTGGRLEVKEIRGIRVIDDSYNANPDSMVAALQTLAGMPAQGRRIAVLGKMNELGAEFESGHRRAGAAAGRAGIDCVVAVGDGAALIAEAAGESGVKEVIRVATTAGAAEVLRKLAQPGDVLLVKGSRSVKMETILEGLAS
jgi:UDP-N-acetylmuramoyl-tripeptide--D-alanyl-D-alanine ligase